MGRYNFNQRTRDGYEISPEQAARWLERNDNNRNVNVAKVKKMAKDMREGHWDTTHQGIAIASDGTLVDGQHRLLAIVESGVTVRMNVTFNAAKSQHIDSGNIRSMANRVQMSEYDMSWTNNTILSAANLIGRVFAGSNHHVKRGTQYARFAFFRTANRLNQYYKTATGQRVAKRVNNGDFPYNVYDADGGIVKPETKKTKKAV